jgi:PEP-CTERM motif
MTARFVTPITSWAISGDTSHMLKSLALAVAVLLVAPASQALTITASDVTVTAADVGQSFTISYDGQSSGTTISGLTASAVYTVTAVTANSISLSVLLSNTSSNPISASRVSVFGFDTNPNVTSASASGAFGTTVLGGALPSGFGSIELCFKNGQGNNCQGGGGTGISLGQSGTTNLTLNFASIGASGVTFSNFGVRYQSIVGAGGITSAVGRGTPPVPEPASMALFGLGALIVGASLRKRARP